MGNLFKKSTKVVFFSLRIWSCQMHSLACVCISKFHSEFNAATLVGCLVVFLMDTIWCVLTVDVFIYRIYISRAATCWFGPPAGDEFQRVQSNSRGIRYPVSLCPVLTSVYDTECVSVFEEPTVCVEYQVCVCNCLRHNSSTNNSHFCVTPGAFGSTLNFYLVFAFPSTSVYKLLNQNTWVKWPVFYRKSKNEVSSLGENDLFKLINLIIFSHPINKYFSF